MHLQLTNAPRPYIAIVGRPNVGKSTLFNRCLGARKAVVSPARGTTRDRIMGRIEWQGKPFTMIDTGGFEFGARQGMGEMVAQQLEQALIEADGVLLVCDGREGLLPTDQMILETLRQRGKPMVMAINKLDGSTMIPAEFYAIGVNHLVPISALHGQGINRLLDLLVTTCPSPLSATLPQQEGHVSSPIALAIVGRQNVGKSSLLNALLSQDRAIVSELAGTTRDAIDTPVTIDGAPIVLIDTAGIRHRRKVTHPVDFFAMSRSFDAIARCDVALLVLDGTQGVTRDDQRIFQRMCDAGCGVVVLVNKWDLFLERRRETTERVSARHLEAQVISAIRGQLHPTMHLPVVVTSAKTHVGVIPALRQSLQIAKLMGQEIPETTATLIRSAWATIPPPRLHGRLLKLHQVQWMSQRPLQLELSIHPPIRLPMAYQHYLLKRLASHQRFLGQPIRLVITRLSPHQRGR